MLENVAVEAGPGRFARALLVLLLAALAIAPAATTSRSASSDSPHVLTRRTCSMSPGDVRPPATIRTRAAGLNPRYLQRELDRDAVHAR